MMESKTRRLKFLFAASVAGGSIAGVVPGAQALCDCMPTSITRPISGAAFKFLGTMTGGYEASLNSDSLYGFTKASAPTIYADYFTRGSQSIFSRVCRIPYWGGSHACGPDSTVSVPSGEQNNDTWVNPAGVYGTSNSAWDYYKLVIKSNSTSQWLEPTGGGVNVWCW